MDRSTYHQLITELIQSEKWDEIRLYEGEKGDDMSSLLIHTLFTLAVYTAQTAHTLDRIIGKVEPEERTQQLTFYVAHFPAIQYYLENERIPIQVAHPHRDKYRHEYIKYPLSLLQYVIMRDTMDCIRNLEVLFAHGADPNEQDEQDGDPILKLYLITGILSRIMVGDIPVKTHIVQYLLEKGADPLLENRRGMNTLKWMEREIGMGTGMGTRMRSYRGATSYDLRQLESVLELLRMYA